MVKEEERISSFVARFARERGRGKREAELITERLEEQWITRVRDLLELPVESLRALPIPEALKCEILKLSGHSLERSPARSGSALNLPSTRSRSAGNGETPAHQKGKASLLFWTQSLSSVRVDFGPLPSDEDPAGIQVKLKRKGVQIVGSDGERTLLHIRGLFATILHKESSYRIKGTHVIVKLLKEQRDIWPSLLDDEGTLSELSDDKQVEARRSESSAPDGLFPAISSSTRVNSERSHLPSIPSRKIIVSPIPGSNEVPQSTSSLEATKDLPVSTSHTLKRGATSKTEETNVDEKGIAVKQGSSGSLTGSTARARAVEPPEGNACCCIPQRSRFRRLAFRIVHHLALEIVITILIVINLIGLAIQQPNNSEPIDSTSETVWLAMDYVITVIFVLEALLRIMALGFVLNPGAYLRDGWNRLDFFVTITSVLHLLPIGMVDLSGFRTLRILKTLRTIPFFDGIGVILESLRLSTRLLLDIIAFMMFYFVIYGLVSVNFFKGVLRGRCSQVVYLGPDLPLSVGPMIEFTTDEVCSQVPNLGLSCNILGLGANVTCAERSANVTLGQDGNFTVEITQHPNPNRGITSFDNIASATLTNFQLSSLEGWTDVLYLVQDAGYAYAWLYFLTLVVIGSFIVLNLFVAVICSTFSECRQKQRDEQKEAMERKKAAASDKKENVFKNAWKALSARVSPCLSRLSCILDPMVRFCNKIISNKWFERVIMFFILANTVTMAMEYYDPVYDTVSEEGVIERGMPIVYEEVLNIFEIVFAYVFILELLLKVIGLGGVINYLKEGQNAFDALVVLTSIQTLVTFHGGAEDNLADTGINISTLRAFRLFRIIRIGRLLARFRRVRILLKTAFGEARAVVNTLFFIAFIMVCWALLGMELFANHLAKDANGTTISRLNFDSFGNAMLSLFVVLTGENWNEVLWDTMEATANSWAAIPYVVGFFIFGNYILLNLFVAVILENFEVEEKQKRELQQQAYERRLKKERKQKRKEEIVKKIIEYSANYKQTFSFKMRLKALQEERRAKLQEAREEKERREPVEAESENASQEREGNHSPERQSDIELKIMGAVSSPNENLASKNGSTREEKPMTPPLKKSNSVLETSLPQEHDETEKKDFPETTRSALQNVLAESRVSSKRFCSFLLGSVPRRDGSGKLSSVDALFCLKPNNPVRRVSQKIVENKWFERIIVFVIVGSAVFLALESPARSSVCVWHSVFTIADTIFVVVFSIEFLLKIVANGFIFTPKGYLKDAWNWVDFFVLMAAYLNLIIQAATDSNFEFVRVLRIIRTLRPLRIVSRNEGIKVTIEAVWRSLPAILPAILLSLTFFLIFAILGLNLFAGKFYSCSYRECDPTGFEVTSVICTNLSTCVSAGYEWRNPAYSFDNTLAALITLIEVSTLEGWISVMWSAVDGTEKGQSPVYDYNPGAIAYFVVFITICSFFILNIFVGIIVDSINQSKGSALLTESQKNWVETRRLMSQLRRPKAPQVPKNSIRRFCYDICIDSKKIRKYGIAQFCEDTRRFKHIHSNFESFIIACIVINVLVMLTEFYDQPYWWSETVRIINLVFLGIFTLEMIIKLVALSLKYYVRSMWNVFDAVIVIGSLVLLPLNETSTIAFARIFRIARLFRVVRKARGLRVLFNTLLMSLPAVGNISLLVFLVFFIYAVIGVQLFARDPFSNGKFVLGTANNETCVSVATYREYEEIGALTRHANYDSFENALLLLFRMSTGESWNEIMHSASQASYIVSILYHISFIYVGVYVFFNLYVAAVLENFESVCSIQDGGDVDEDDLRHFRTVWLRFDLKSSGFIPLRKLREFLETLGPPLGREAPLPRFWLQLVRDECSRIVDKERGLPFRKLLITLGVLRMGFESMTVDERLGQEGKIQKRMQDKAASKIKAVMKAYITWRRLTEKDRERLRKTREIIQQSRVIEALKSTKSIPKDVQEKGRINAGMRIRQALQRNAE